jgi:hypothetical protein
MRVNNTQAPLKMENTVERGPSDQFRLPVAKGICREMSQSIKASSGPPSIMVEAFSKTVSLIQLTRESFVMASSLVTGNCPALAMV